MSRHAERVGCNRLFKLLQMLAVSLTATTRMEHSSARTRDLRALSLPSRATHEMPASHRLRTFRDESRCGALNFASWNHIKGWLRELDSLRRVA